MLTVTIILAAIVSGFAGGVAKSQQKPPQLVFDASIVNEGPGTENSFLDIRVISVSEGIPSRDLKFQTEWRNTVVNRTSINPSYDGYPLGSDPGSQVSQPFGNYTILAGTHIFANNTAGMKAVLTNSWDQIKEGTPVRIQFIHIPSGAVIADKEFTVEV